MPYALLDDQFHSNPKVIAMGLDGAGLYTRALSYIADYGTDGFVPETWLTGVIGRQRKLVNHLAGVGAWELVEPGDELEITDRSGNEFVKSVRVRGVFVPDYCSFNLSSVEHEARRKEKSRAGKKGAIKRWGDNTSDSTSHGSRHSTSQGVSHSETMARARAAPSPSPTPNQDLSIEKGLSSKRGDTTNGSLATRKAEALIRNLGHELTAFSVDDELVRLSVPETDRPRLREMAENLRTAHTERAIPSNAAEEDL